MSANEESEPLTEEEREELRIILQASIDAEEFVAFERLLAERDVLAADNARLRGALKGLVEALKRDWTMRPSNRPFSSLDAAYVTALAALEPAKEGEG